MKGLITNATNSDNSSSSGSCEGMYRFESDPLCSLLIVLAYLLTMFLCFGMSRFVFVKTSIGHPVFRIVFHEVLVLSVTATSLLAVFAVKKSIADFSTAEENLNFLVWVLISFAMYFHQISWLCITCLRYYLMVYKRNADVDMAALRRLAIKIVWVAAPLYLSLSIVPSFVINISHGWPEKPHKELGKSVTILNVAMSILLSNVPDFISMCVYAKMWLALRPKVTPLEAQEDENPYGGIWVGEGGIQPGGYQEFEMQEMQQSSEEDSSEAPEPPPPGEEELPPDEDDDKAKSVMRVLRTHVAVSLLDLTSIASSLLLCTKYGGALAYLMQFLFAFWIPLFVVSRNFKQFHPLWSKCCCTAS